LDPLSTAIIVGVVKLLSKEVLPIYRLCATYALPSIAAPPDTISAPVVVLVVSTPLLPPPAAVILIVWESVL
jgi:hypothetical protein